VRDEEPTGAVGMLDLDEPGAFFGYLVGDRSPIHNSNLHACAFLARLGRRVGNEVHLAYATRGVECSLARQRPDGSWPYGEMSSLGWVDGFHTGYVLDALDVCIRAHVPLDILPAWERGLPFYRAHLFFDDGTPKYYSNAVYPIDSSCVAQGIQRLALAADRDASCLSQSWGVLGGRCAECADRRAVHVPAAPAVGQPDPSHALGRGVDVPGDGAPARHAALWS